jgi:hypothetical protein
LFPSNLLIGAIAIFSHTGIRMVAFTTFRAGCRNSFGIFLLHLHDRITLSLLDYDVGRKLTTLILLEGPIRDIDADLTGLRFHCAVALLANLVNLRVSCLLVVYIPDWCAHYMALADCAWVKLGRKHGASSFH